MKRSTWVFLICLLGMQQFLAASEPASLYPGFPPSRQSKAYKKFSVRTYSEFSKILYLIDRYSDSKILINYDDQTYTAAFSTTVARWFLSRNYKKQTAKEWIHQWCNKSIVYGKPIFVKLPDGKFRPAREILLEELAVLERIVKENQNGGIPTVETPAKPAVSSAADALAAEASAAKNSAEKEITASASVAVPAVQPKA